MPLRPATFDSKKPHCSTYGPFKQAPCNIIRTFRARQSDQLTGGTHQCRRKGRAGANKIAHIAQIRLAEPTRCAAADKEKL
jgi:hypothetical protein